MPKGLTDEQKAAVSAEEVKTRILLTITLNNPDADVLRILENDTLEVLDIDGFPYIGGCVKRGDIKSDNSGSLETCNITISNINQNISSIVVNEGDVLTDSECVIEEIIYDTGTDAIIDEPIELFRGKINNIHLNYAEFSFDVERTIGGHDFEAPRTSYDVSCQWMFKDERCQYSGDISTCDKTLTQCTARSNHIRFGGYPSIPIEMIRR